MLVRHSLTYLLARVVTGLVNFGAIALFTRLLLPHEYGIYVLIVATIGLLNSVVFWWLRQGIVRFYAGYAQEQRHVLLSTALAGLLGLWAVTAVVGGLLIVVWTPARINMTYCVLGLGLAGAQAYFELHLTFLQSDMLPNRHMVLSLAKAVLSLIMGGTLAYVGWGAKGVLVGTIVAIIGSIFILERHAWKGLHLRFVDRQLLTRLLRYGLPLTVTFAMGYVVSSVDRLLLSIMASPEAVGTYAVAYDMAQQTITLLMMSVTSAVYPLAVQAYEQGGPNAVRKTMIDHATLLLLVALPATAGLIVLTPNIVGVVLGPQFRTTAYTVMPVIVVAALIEGTKAYYFDLAFQIGQRTRRQISPLLVAAALNVALNMWWIPRWGVVGAAYSTLAAYVVALAASWHLGRDVLPLPVPVQPLVRIGLATLGMTCAIWPIVGYRGPLALAVQITWGGLVYGVGVLLLNVMGLRRQVARQLALFAGRIG